MLYLDTVYFSGFILSDWIKFVNFLIYIYLSNIYMYIRIETITKKSNVK